jgi:hypothetical protein
MNEYRGGTEGIFRICPHHVAFIILCTKW